MVTTRKKAARAKKPATNGRAAKTASKRPSSNGKAKTKAAAKGATRTSSRSAKRRSPKDPPPDPALMELERLQFLRAMDRYKRKTGKTFPSWTEVLEVLRGIGWVSPAKLELDRSKTKA